MKIYRYTYYWLFSAILFLNFRYEEDFTIQYTDFDNFADTRESNETLKLGINYIPLMYETEKIKLEYVPKPNHFETLRRYLKGKELKTNQLKPNKLLQDSDGPFNPIWLLVLSRR